MKKNVFIVIFGLSIFFGLFYVGVRQYEAFRNDKNSKKIKIDDTTKHMIEIMGNPDSKYFSTLEKSQEVYFYQPPFGASEGISIYVDTLSNKVVKLEFFK